jgi:hypothetical protein
MNSLITSADQLDWITPDKLNASDYRRIDTEGAYALAVIDDDNLLAIYIDVIDDDVRVTMDRVCGDVRFTSDDPGEWTDIEAVIPRSLWPAQVWAGSKWTSKERPTYPAIDAAIAVALADYEANNE